MRTHLWIWAVCLWLVLSSAVASAAVPQSLPVQVAVTSSAGGPATDGTYAVQVA